MSIRVAHGQRKNMDAAIESGSIPKGSMIFTKDSKDPEFFFYDTEGNLAPISERNRFETMSEAKSWVSKYPCVGNIITIHNGTDWMPYIVQSDNTLTPIEGGNVDVNIDITDVTRIDGGNSDGV